MQLFHVVLVSLEPPWKEVAGKALPVSQDVTLESVHVPQVDCSAGLPGQTAVIWI